MAETQPHSLWVVHMVREQGLRDEEGRLLRESRAPAACIRPGEIEYKPCPYPGSRKVEPPMPMNISALRAMSAHWDDIVNSVALMRVGYEQLRQSTRMELWDVWRVTQLGSALPWYYILGFGELAPAYAANLAKATLGMGIWAQKVFARTLTESWTPPPLSSRVIHELAEGNLTYFADHEVCAGPEKMLLRFYDAMLDLAPDPASPHMTRLAKNLPGVLAFGAHYLNMKLVLYVMYLGRRFLYADLVAALPDHPLAAELRELADAPCLPPDFFTLGPADLAATPAPARAAFLAQIAQHLVPLAPDGSDRPLQAAVVEMAAAVAFGQAPAAVVAELVGSGLPADRAELAARAIGAWATLDRLHGQAMRAVEDGMRTAVGAARFAGDITAPDRDTLVGTDARGILSRLAPRGLSSLLAG